MSADRPAGHGLDDRYPTEPFQPVGSAVGSAGGAEVRAARDEQAEREANAALDDFEHSAAADLDSILRTDLMEIEHEHEPSHLEPSGGMLPRGAAAAVTVTPADAAAAGPDAVGPDAVGPDAWAASDARAASAARAASVARALAAARAVAAARDAAARDAAARDAAARDAAARAAAAARDAAARDASAGGRSAVAPRDAAAGWEPAAGRSGMVVYSADDVEVDCPGCGLVVVGSDPRASADWFCPRCDYPLFFVAKPAPPEPDAARRGARRRLPGVNGRASSTAGSCWNCGEWNESAVGECFRCAATLPKPAPPQLGPFEVREALEPELLEVEVLYWPPVLSTVLGGFVTGVAFLVGVLMYMDRW